MRAEAAEKRAEEAAAAEKRAVKAAEKAAAALCNAHSGHPGGRGIVHLA